jgi:hypothetical protein
MHCRMLGLVVRLGIGDDLFQLSSLFGEFGRQLCASNIALNH